MGESPLGEGQCGVMNVLPVFCKGTRPRRVPGRADKNVSESLCGGGYESEDETEKNNEVESGESHKAEWESTADAYQT